MFTGKVRCLPHQPDDSVANAGAELHFLTAKSFFWLAEHL
jgi:hypothetical protein